MTKNVREQIRTRKTARVEHPIIPPKYQHLAAIAVIYISILIFFHAMVFEGKKYQAVDSIPAWDTFMKDAQIEGYAPLWNPYIFCGYPGYAGLTYPVPQSFDVTTIAWEKVGRVILSYLFFEEGSSGAYLLFYLVYGIGMYLLAYRFLKKKPIAVIVALMAVYATYVALLIMMGHITKLAVLSWFPYVFLIIDKLREKFNLFWALLLPIFIRLLLQPAHVQYIFYIYLALGIYLLFFFIQALIRKENWKPILASGMTLLLATGLAFLMGATQHFSTWEYNPYSMRGANPIQTDVSSSDNKTVTGGLDYKYATDFSFSPGEIMTFFIPSWYGFGPTPYQGELFQNQPVHLPLYLGRQPIVDCPQYMGIVVIVLALIGFYRNRKELFVQYMGFMIVFALLISFGREFPLIYDLMYRYFPMFNKFRVPVIILILVQFFTPILAGYGILSFVKEQYNTMSLIQKKRWKFIFGGLAITFFATLIGNNIIKDIYSAFFPIKEVGNTLAQNFRQQLNPTVLAMLYDFIFSNIITDILVGCSLLIVVFGVFYYFQKGKLSSTPLYSILVLAVLFDLWRVAWKPHDPVTPQEAGQVFTTPNYIKVLEQDTTQYRVLKLENGQPAYDNTLAYWRLHNAYGYHGAKMRIYQDMVDVAGMGNPLVWQLMNIKYLITNTEYSNPMLRKVYEDRETKVYEFQYWLPHVFFVNKYEIANGLGTLNKIASLSFDPRDIAYILEDPKTTIDPPKEGSHVTMVKYGTQDLEVHATATGNNLLFLSDAYYPKGWEAYIDGKETEILRLNYLFRGIIVPQGTHTLIMKFESQMFYLGKKVSFWTTSLIFCMLTFTSIIYGKKKFLKIVTNK